MADSITVDPLAPPSPPAPGTVAPMVAPVVAPSVPAKPKAAFLIIEPLEVPTSELPDKDGKVPPPGKEQIVATGALTVVMVKTSGAPNKYRFNAVKLPKAAADLSVVEVHRDPASTGPDVAVFPNKDEQI